MPSMIHVRRHGGLLSAVAVALLALSGCATKGDIRLLRTDMSLLQARQDSLFRTVAQQNATLMDSVRSSFNMQRNTRGELGHDLTQLGQQIVTLQQLLGQTQQAVADLREQMRTTTAPGQAASPPPAGASASDAQTYYELGITKLREGSFATARLAFEAMLREFPDDERAPDARYQIAETFYQEGDAERAVAELETIPQQWPASTRAPQAIFRAGAIAEEENDTAGARAYYRLVQQRYPDSEERQLAEARLQALN